MSEGGIVRRILYPGYKKVKFVPGSKVYIHFQTRLCNADNTLLDDTRLMGTGKPMELIIGKKFKVRVLEQIVQIMLINEVSQFTICKELVLDYPFLSKTLRDLNKPESQRSRRCCGMMLQNEGLGYQDLNDYIKNPVDLEIIIELLKVELPGEYEKESWQMTEEEKLQMVPLLKEKGNTAYRDKDYREAVDNYSTAIGYLEQLMLKEKPNEEEWLQLQQQKVPLLSNLSQCKLFENDYYAAIEHCNTVLSIEPDNIKALYRRAKAHIGAWNPEQARKDLNRIQELDNSFTNIVNAQLAELDRQIKARAKEDKERFKKLF